MYILISSNFLFWTTIETNLAKTIYFGNALCYLHPFYQNTTLWKQLTRLNLPYEK